MGEADLLAQIALSKTLLAELPYSDRVTVTPHSPAEIVAHGEEINVLSRTAHPLGDVLGVSGDNAVLLSYFRNNVHNSGTVRQLLFRVKPANCLINNLCDIPLLSS
jgi:glycerol-3-phosphate O-acyltransferase